MGDKQNIILLQRMTSQNSEDPSLGEICIVVLFFNDGATHTVDNYDSQGLRPHSGDLIYLQPYEQDRTITEICVILGWGG